MTDKRANPINDASAEPDEATVLEACRWQPLTPEGRAQRVGIRYGSDFLHTPGAGWRTWVGTHWDHTTAEQDLVQAVSVTMAKIEDEATLIDIPAPPEPLRKRATEQQKTEHEVARNAHAAAEDHVKSVRKFGRASTAPNVILGVIGILKRSQVGELGGFGTTEHSFDADADKLNFTTGTLDIARPDFDWEREDDPYALALVATGSRIDGLERHPHRREDRITRVLPLAWTSGSWCPRWLDAIRQWTGGDDTVADFLQELFGYALSGRGTEKRLFIVYGPTDSGKSLCLRTMQDVFGPYATSLSTDALVEKRHGDDRHHDLVCLHGARLAVASETGNRRQTFDSPMLKKLTSGGIDGIQVRDLRKSFFELRNVAAIFITTNEPPRVTDFDAALWNRLTLIPFPHSLPKSDQLASEQLMDAFRTERSGILNWVLEGMLRWREDYGAKLLVPESVRLATERYRRQEDWLGRFLDECTEPAPGERVVIGDVFRSYQVWAQAGLEDVVSQQTFGREMRKRGFESRNSHGTRYYTRLRLRDDAPGREGDWQRLTAATWS